MENYDALIAQRSWPSNYEEDSDTSDKMAREYALENGYDVLLTNKSGSRTIAKLEETDRPFWAGFASQGVAVSILNAKVGIAGAHFMTTKPEVFYDNLKSAFSKDRKAEERKILVGGLSYIMGAYVPLEHRVERVVSAIETAAKLYNEMAAGVNGKNTPWACLTGICYGTKDDLKILKSAAVKTLKNNLRSEPSIDIEFGQPGGILYGGPRSEKAPLPVIINLERSSY